jgi:dGTPase
MSKNSEKRLHASLAPDQRRAFARDRDRLLYAASFRRLAGVTQVVGALEGHVFHNRLTHTIKVAQIARRLAEIHVRDTTGKKTGIDPDVVETAALAHDLGHPPFGHIAEERLNFLVRKAGDNEGFEGNAQSFRIVTRLEAHRPEYPGLNLTKASLLAVLKHPSFRKELLGPPEQQEKFGAYRDDSEAFEFIREGMADGVMSLEAEVMDVADSIAYSVHDLDDFHRAGLVPIAELAHDDYAFRQFIAAWKNAKKPPPTSVDRYLDQLRSLLLMYAPTDAENRYDDPWEQQGDLQYVSSFLIGRYVRSYRLEPLPIANRRLVTDPGLEMELRFLQRLVWHYVIENPRLATQQHGQRRIIETLFDVFLAAAQDADLRMIPPLMHREVRRINASGGKGSGVTTAARVAADIVCSFTDAQAALLYRRLSGVSTGSVGDLLVV